MTQEPQDYPDTQTQETLTPGTENAPTVPLIPQSWGRLEPISKHLQLVDLNQDSVVLGRVPGCNIFVDKSNYPENLIGNVSKKHFEITRGDDGQPVFMNDYSKNGTYINGELVGRGKMQVLMNGDKIALGKPGPNGEGYVFRYQSFLVSNTVGPIELEQKYALTKTLGIGGCGEVFLAYERTTCQKYAVKKIRKGNYRSNSTHHLNHPKKIKQEIEILQSLNHPFIIQVKEIIDSESDVFIVLEFMEGGELRKRIPSLSEAEVKFIFYQLVLGVEYLHAQGIIHRDIKPDNILLTSNSRQYFMKITDFGLSKIIEDDQLTKSICGTPQYVAPEIIRRCRYDQKVDVWSLGVVLYQMLVKELPFPVVQKMPNYNKVLDWGCSNKLVSGVVKDLIKKMLRQNPNERISIKEIRQHPWINKDISMQYRVHQLLENNGLILDTSSDDDNDEPSVPSKRFKLSGNDDNTESTSGFYTFT